MNDFTKEELIEILDNLPWEPDSVGYSEFRKNIYKKIDLMIENYCDHIPESQTSDDSCLFVACKTCKELLWDE